MRAPLFLGYAPLLASLTAFGCAESGSVDILGQGNGPGSGGASGGGGAAPSATSSSSSSSAAAGTGGGGQGGQGGSGGQGGEDPCALGCLPGTWDIDGSELTGECGCEYACEQVSTTEDPIDGDFQDDNCDGGDGVVERCVYVSVSQGTDANPGTRMEPKATIAAAIDAARTGGVPAVCLSGEVYEEAVTVVSGISIYGGFDHNNPDFKFRRSPGVTTVVRAIGTVFDAPSIDQPTHIEGLRIEAQRASTLGESTYGIRLGGGMAELFVRFNEIDVQSGQDGADGMEGAPHASPVAPPGNNGQNGCDACSGGGFGGARPMCTEYGGKGGDGGYDNGNGGAGENGSGSALGGFGGVATGECGDRSGSGVAGQSGTNGTQGSPGTGGASLGRIVSGLYEPAAGTDGLPGTRGRGGAGGGGGGGGSCQLFGFCTCDRDRGGGGGSGGCGGLGGRSGRGGRGGGGSFGVFAAAGNVVVFGNEITTGTGGRGGRGGNGGDGQAGSQGGTGGTGFDDSGSGRPGGTGGNGGNGGPGAGGGGGPSACLARSGSVVFTFETNTCVTGTAGFGGEGGTNASMGLAGSGQTGTAAANLQIN